MSNSAPASVVLETPESTVAVVLLAHGSAGDLEARYAEGRSRIPAPRRQVADALRALADELEGQAAALEERDS